MEQQIVKRWERGKENLRNWFKTHKQQEYDDYTKIVSALIKYCLNFGDYDVKFSEDFEVSDHEDYQGTQIFILHQEEYEPNLCNYYIFDNYYGSCSGCDTLLGISGYDCGLPDDGQVAGYMQLCLHIVQRMKCLEDVFNNE